MRVSSGHKKGEFLTSHFPKAKSLNPLKTLKDLRKWWNGQNQPKILDI